MSSQSDEENGVHPLVSNLLGQKFIPRTGHVFRYDRDEMIRLSTTPLSMQRPEILSVDFNGDDGKFSPFKWLEHRWEVEGIKNRAPTKKLQDALNAGAMDDNAGLSPQRRGFSSGCRAPTDEKSKEGVPSSSGFTSEAGWTGVERDRDRLGTNSTRNWRGGSNGGADKYSNKSSDFKLPFQKSTGANSRSSGGGGAGSWRAEMKERGPSVNSGKYSQSKSQREERMPEWADGSTTMDDMIELRGFEEPVKKSKRGSGSRAKEEKEKEKEKKGEGRKESLENGKLDQHRMDDSALGSRSVGPALPETDAEFAAILGLLDMQDDGCMSGILDKVSTATENTSAAAASTGSRLSRFFNKNNSQSGSNAQNSRTSQDDPQSSNPLLAKIFAQTPSSGGQTPQNPAQGLGLQGNPSMPPTVAGPGGVRAMRLEDLEKAISSKDARITPITKGNPLQDPNQQAHLLNRLQSFAKQQEENVPMPSSGPSPSAPNVAPSVGGVFPPGATPFLPPVLPPGAPMVPPGLLARMAAENPALVQAHIQAQLHQAMAAQLAANGGVGVTPAHMHDQIRATLLRLQQQQLVAAAAAQGKLGKVRPPTQMIPSSVQRQMNKASTSQAEDTAHRGSRTDQDGSPTHMAEPEVLEAAARNNADMLKKMQMQHQYAAMMNAMQGGLPMAAWRPPPPSSNSAVPPNPQAQAQILMQMAQVQQLAHAQQQMRLKQQALAKIMQLQGHQQAVAAAAGVQVQPNVAERTSQNYTGSSSFAAASDLSGPIQSPLEKLLAAAGVQPSQFTGGAQESSSFQNSSQGIGPVGARMPPPSARPMSLEELERKLTEQTK
ncbi:Eukaryotic translation initiation factor 4E [Trichostrongylus colubriformis]|uniref:Eukaryotic translation initiation factor 4E n=1 Tax=Trichostrongylus colubriformis TaxID=6319 RepID=A0AAN8IVY2_TRICO